MKQGLFALVVFICPISMLNSCANISLTKPLCGPESYDQRPSSSLPDNAVGCYEVPSGLIDMGLTTNIFTAREYTKSYVFLSKSSAGNTEVFSNRGLSENARSRLSRDDNDQFFITWCEVPGKFAHPNARLMMTQEKGWYQFIEYKYEVENQVLVISSYSPSIASLKKSELRYAVATDLNNSSYPAGFPKQDVLSSDINLILIDNSQVSPEQLFEKLQYSKSVFHYELRKVNKSFCDQHAKNKIL